MTMLRLTLLLALAAAPVLAEEAKPATDKPADNKDYKPYNAGEVIAKFDKNGDKKLSLLEFAGMAKFKKESDSVAAAKKEFEAADKDKDGSVTAEELLARHEEKAKKAIEAREKKAKEEAKPATPGQ